MKILRGRAGDTSTREKGGGQEKGEQGGKQGQRGGETGKLP
jgi:hypothetical protein